ncbi:hypothetical protein [Flavobacterium faecale]|uniref:hypothetical protein n=1 Tax=Flavobacterium faecale TaxID=1355330 RepID=UPI003AAFF9C2
MKKIVLTLVIAMFAIIGFPQNHIDSTPKRPLNSIFINLLGDASIISANYEKLFFVNSSFILSGKLGLGYNEEYELCIFGSCSSSTEQYLTIPHHITGNWGKGRNFFEFGLGGTIINGNTSQNYLLYPIVGYRLQPLKSNKVNFRIFGQIPFSGIETVDILFIPFGVSAGVNF